MTEREFAISVVRRLREAGHEALWAGGCVRDELLGLVPGDYDVATDARPEEACGLVRRAADVGSNCRDGKATPGRERGPDRKGAAKPAAVSARGPRRELAPGARHGRGHLAGIAAHERPAAGAAARAERRPVGPCAARAGA